jgi:hypothetical protein
MHKPLTVIRHDGLIRNHIEPTPFGSRRVATVRPSEVQAWVTDRSKVLAPLTVRILVGLVRSAFNAAVVDRIVGASPFQKIVLPRVERDRIVPLTVEQVDELADVIGDRYRAMVVAQAGLGLRIGELLACASRTSTFSAVRFESSIRLTSAPGSGCRQRRHAAAVYCPCRMSYRPHSPSTFGCSRRRRTGSSSTPETECRTGTTSTRTRPSLARLPRRELPRGRLATICATTSRVCCSRLACRLSTSPNCLATRMQPWS